MSKRILLIAPDVPGIESDIEAELIGGNYFNVTPLVGEVTQERITRAIHQKTFDGIHYATHASKNGVVLSNGDVLSKEQVAQIAKLVDAELVYLNACDSAKIGQYLADRGVPVTVAHTDEVLDADAIRTASHFYTRSAQYDGDYRKAYDFVSPKDGTLAMFSGASYYDKAIMLLTQAMNKLQDAFESLKVELFGQGQTLTKIVIAVLAIMLLINVVVLYMIAEYATAEAAPAYISAPKAQEQTIPPTATALPGCNSSNGQPKKCGTETPTEIPTSVATDTPQPTNTAVASATSFVLPTDTAVATATLEEPTADATPTDKATNTRVPEPTATATETSEPTETSTSTATVTKTHTPQPTDTLTPQPTSTATDEESSNFKTNTPTTTSTPAQTATATSTATQTATPLPPDVLALIERSVRATVEAMDNICLQICMEQP